MYRLATFGADAKGYWLIEIRKGKAAKGEPPTVHRVKLFKTQGERDLYMSDRKYI